MLGSQRDSGCCRLLTNFTNGPSIDVTAGNYKRLNKEMVDEKMVLIDQGGGGGGDHLLSSSIFVCAQSVVLKRNIFKLVRLVVFINDPLGSIGFTTEGRDRRWCRVIKVVIHCFLLLLFLFVSSQLFLSVIFLSW